MAVADEIIDLLRRKRRLKLSASDIADMLYWEDQTYKQRVRADCLMLYEQNRLCREGKGSVDDPYVYGISSVERRNQEASD
jgi:hypothetical protein